MSYTYAQTNKHESEINGAEPFCGSGEEFSLPNSAMMNVLGHRVDMPVVMREKMEDSFGMDLSSVKLYENRAVGEAGAEAVTKGNNIAFAPGKLDFSSVKGQALLGHEISHVASQAKGEVKGSGLVNDSALEARADQEGLKAARGKSIASDYGGASAPLSNASAASAAGPMQAKSGKKAREKQETHDRGRADFESANNYYSTREADEDEELDMPELNNAIAIENNPVGPEPKNEEVSNNPIANMRSKIEEQQAEIDRENFVKNVPLEEKRSKQEREKIYKIKAKILKKPKKLKYQYSKKLKPVGIIREVDEDHFEEQINENIPDEIINDPEKERSKFLAFMQKTVNTHPAQQQVLDFLNDRKFRNRQPQKKKKNEPDDIIINSRKRKRKINRNNY